ncbi:MAG: DUF4369 domain-containing protein, partial [Chitinophagaceae bacterium]
MKNLLPVLLLSVLSLGEVAAQTAVSTANIETANKSERFTITGNVQGLGDAEVKISNIRDNQVVATTMSKAGVFTVSGTVAEPGLYWLTVGSEKPRYIFLENSPIKITGTKADIKNLKIEGSASQKEFVLFEQTFNPIFANLNAVANEINSSTSDAKKAQLMP